MNDNNAAANAANYMKACNIDAETVRKYFPDFDPASDSSIRYNGDTLAESKQFMKHMWAASIALDPNSAYTISEGQILVSAFLNRKVG